MPQYSPGVFAAGAAAILAAAFILGWLAKPGGLSRNGKRIPSAEKERSRIIGRLLGRPAPPEAARGWTPDLRQALHKALRQDDWRIRFYYVRRLVQAVSADEIRQAAAFAVRQSESAQKDELLSALVERWGELDGAAAWEYTRENTTARQRENMEIAALSGWGRKDPEGAWRRVRAHPPLPVSRSMAVFRAIAGQDPEAAWAKASALPEGELKNEAVAALCLYLFRRGGIQAALPRLETLPEGPSRSLCMSRLASYWGYYQPEAAAGWLADSLPGPSRREALRSLAAVWADQDPRAALDWAAELPAGEARSQCLVTSIPYYLEQAGTGSASEWLNQFNPHPDFDGAVRHLALRAMEENPEAAMTWADSIVNRQARVETMISVGEYWLETDGLNAREYLREHPDPPPALIGYLSGAETGGMEPAGNGQPFLPPADTRETEYFHEEILEPEILHDTREHLPVQSERAMAWPEREKHRKFVKEP